MVSLIRRTYIGQNLLKKTYSLEKKEDKLKYSFISESKIEFIAFLSFKTFKNLFKTTETNDRVVVYQENGIKSEIIKCCCECNQSIDKYN